MTCYHELTKCAKDLALRVLFENVGRIVCRKENDNVLLLDGPWSRNPVLS